MKGGAVLVSPLLIVRRLPYTMMTGGAVFVSPL